MTKYSIFHSMTEPYSPWKNYAEDCIRVIKNSARYFMQATQTPIRLFNHELMCACDIRNLTESSSVTMKGRTPFEVTLGYSPDISEYTIFEWYQYIWYWEPENPQKQMLGRWLGVEDHIGNGLTYKIININTEVISRSTVINLKGLGRMKKQILKLNKERAPFFIHICSTGKMIHIHKKYPNQ